MIARHKNVLHRSRFPDGSAIVTVLFLDGQMSARAGRISALPQNQQLTPVLTATSTTTPNAKTAAHGDAHGRGADGGRARPAEP